MRRGRSSASTRRRPRAAAFSPRSQAGRSGAFRRKKASSARPSSRPTAPFTSARPTATSTRSTPTGRSRWKVADRRDHRLLRAARRSRPRLLRLRRRHAARRRREDRRAGLDVPGRRSDRRQGVHQLVRGQRRDRPRRTRSTCRTTTSSSTPSIATRRRRLVRYKMPDQTWSLPAVDATQRHALRRQQQPAAGARQEHLLHRGGRDTTNWAVVVARHRRGEPAAHAGGAVVVGGFDGYLARRTRTTTASELWKRGDARPHLREPRAAARRDDRASPRPTGPSTPSTPTTGSAASGRSTPATPIRSSPAVDGDGNVYVGGGDGRLYVLNAGRHAALGDEAHRRRAQRPQRLARARRRRGLHRRRERRDVQRAVRLVPARPRTQSDARCTTRRPPARRRVARRGRTPSATLQPAAPARSPANAPITLAALRARAGGAAARDPRRDDRSRSPSIRRRRRPSTSRATASSSRSRRRRRSRPGPLQRHGARRATSTSFQRAGLRLSGGQRRRDRRRHSSRPRSARRPRARSTPTATYELSRLSIPLPTVMPSYNQIGFDSLHYLLGTVRAGRGEGRRVDGRREAAARAAAASSIPRRRPSSRWRSRPRTIPATFEAASGLQVQIVELHAPVPVVPARDGGSSRAATPRDRGARGERRLRRHRLLRAVPPAARAVQPADGRHPRARRGERPAAHRPRRSSAVGTVTFAQLRAGVSRDRHRVESRARAARRVAAAVDAATGQPVPLALRHRDHSQRQHRRHARDGHGPDDGTAPCLDARLLDGGHVRGRPR